MIKEEAYTHIADADLIHKVLNGETAYFELLIRRSNPLLYKLGRSYGYDHQDTEDLMQEAYVSAYLNLSKFENRASFKTWVTTIMLNHCKRKQQKLSFKNEIVNDKVTDEKMVPMYSQKRNADAAILNKELANVIESSLENIPADYRMVFSLRELNKFSVAETANILGITETNVKVRLNRAKKMLRNRVEKMYMPEDIFEFNLIYCDRIVENVMNRIAQLNA
jgi:RNA polymerase sigma factor (sigma-70 family)